MAVTKLTGFANSPKFIIPVVVDVASITNAETADVEFAVPGCTTGDTGILVPGTAPTMGIVWTTGFCSTAGTMLFRFGNITGSPINLDSQTFYVMVL